MKPTPIPIALRAYTVRRQAEGAKASPEASCPATAARGATTRAALRWPKHVLVFDTETTADAVQRLTFGSYRAVRWNQQGGLALIAEGLFHADDLAEWDPVGLAELERYGRAHGIGVLSRRAFMEQVFRRVAIELRGLVVGFNLPFDLSRIAVEAGEARGSAFYGGFSFVLWDYQDKQSGEWRENPYRPRVCVKRIDSKRAFIGFALPMATGAGNPSAFRGHFPDLRTLAYALSGTGHSLATACKAFGTSHGKLAIAEHGAITAEYIDYNRADVLATQGLLAKMRVAFDQLGLSLPPTRAYSPASIAKASLRDMGIRPLLGKAPTISDVDLGRTMTAFFGGRAECRVRRSLVPVVTVDFRSMYPTVSCLLGLWKILTAESIRCEDYTDAFRALLATASLERVFDPRLWPQLCAFVEIEPEGDILPVRGQYSDTREGLNIGVNCLTSPAPLIYAAADVYASALLTGKAPRIRRAWKLVGEGTQPGLNSIMLGGKVPVDPSADDFFRVLIEERVRVKNSSAYAPDERDRIAQQLKITANSLYGIFAEMNREELPSETTETIGVFGHGEPFEHRTNAPEEMGEYCFPPIAALIASAARLMLALLERRVTDRDGSYAYCDTDSMGIIASEHGGLIECEGGTADRTDRIPAVRALSRQAGDDIRDAFARLNPYDPTVIPSILNIEDVNFHDGRQRDVAAHVISAKRYALAAWKDDGAIALLKGSEHGLGHLLSPIPGGQAGEWPKAFWEVILAEECEIPHESPDWLQFPAVSRLSVSSPAYFRGFLRRYANLPYPKRIKPFGFLLSAQVARFGHPTGVDPTAFHLLAPYSTDPREWTSQLWTDAYSGNEYGITTAPSYLPGLVRVKSFADVKAEFLAHGEVKSAAPDGEPAGVSARGLLQRRHVAPSEMRLVGKESNCLEAVERGLVGDWGEVLSTYTGGKNRPSPESLTGAPAAVIAQACSVSVRTVRAWRRKGRTELKPPLTSDTPGPATRLA